MCFCKLGQALAVDRELFSQKVTEELEKNPLIEIIHQEVTEIEKIAEKGIVNKPHAFVCKLDLNELLHTISAKFLLLCASVNLS